MLAFRKEKLTTLLKPQGSPSSALVKFITRPYYQRFSKDFKSCRRKLSCGYLLLIGRKYTRNCVIFICSCTFKSTLVRMHWLIILIWIQISALSIPRLINDSEFGFKNLAGPPGRFHLTSRPPGPDHRETGRSKPTHEWYCVMCHNVWRKQGL